MFCRLEDCEASGVNAHYCAFRDTVVRGRIYFSEQKVVARIEQFGEYCILIVVFEESVDEIKSGVDVFSNQQESDSASALLLFVLLSQLLQF